MTRSTRTLPCTALRCAVGAFVGTIVLFGGMGLNAQSFGSHDSSAPVTYNAGRMELQDRQNRVVLSDNVMVTQAGLTVRSDRMLVKYSDGGELDIDTITATGGVRVTRGDTAAQGDVAVYDLDRSIITMAGNVHMQRGGDTLNGGRLVINLQSGVASVDGRGASTPQGDGQRVTGTFTVPQKPKDQ